MKCPACKSADTERLYQIGNDWEYLCLKCSNGWTRPVTNGRAEYLSPLDEWSQNGEEI